MANIQSKGANAGNDTNKVVRTLIQNYPQKSDGPAPPTTGQLWPRGDKLAS